MLIDDFLCLSFLSKDNDWLVNKCRHTCISACRAGVIPFFILDTFNHVEKNGSIQLRLDEVRNCHTVYTVYLFSLNFVI